MDDRLEKIINVGIEPLNCTWEACALGDETRTLVVVGPARGGTSMLSGCLVQLGVFMGNSARRPVYEDLHIRRAMEIGSNSELMKLISDYNERHKVWGFKYPGSIYHLRRLHTRLRNPFYLFLFRDIFSIANRTKISSSQNLQKGMTRALNDYSKIIKFIDNEQPVGLLLSYEKALRNKELLVKSLMDIVGLDESEIDARNRTLEYVTPTPKEYLRKSRITASVGKLTVVGKRRVAGWARFHSSDRPAKVVLEVNGNYIATTTANLRRQNPANSLRPPIKQCAFKFSLSAENAISLGDIVRTYVKDEVYDLEHSPVTFQGRKWISPQVRKRNVPNADNSVSNKNSIHGIPISSPRRIDHAELFGARITNPKLIRLLLYGVRLLPPVFRPLGRKLFALRLL